MPSDIPGDRSPIDAIRGRLEALDQERVAPESIARHCDNLARLADHLRKLGMDDRTITAEVMGIFRDYERALAASLVAAERER